MSESTITYRGTVYPWQCDHMGHMNVMWYAGRFDEASWQLLSMMGLTAARFREECVGMAAVEQHVRYLHELHAGDPITVRSAILELGTTSIRLMHEMRNDATGDTAATSAIVAVYIDATMRKARPLPTDVRQRVAHVIDDVSPGLAARPCGTKDVDSLPGEGKC